MPRSHFLLATLALLAAARCVPRTDLAGLYCEGGVRDGREAQGGQCLDVRTDKPDGDVAAIGTATWLLDSLAGPPYGIAVHATASKDAFTMHRDGVQVGTIQRNDNWLKVTFTKVPPGSRTLVGSPYHLRSDMPGAFN